MPQATSAAVIAETVRQRVAAQAVSAAAAQVDAVLASAEANRQVILRHRAELADARALLLALLAELRRAIRDPEQLAQIAQQARVDVVIVEAERGVGRREALPHDG